MVTKSSYLCFILSFILCSLTYGQQLNHDEECNSENKKGYYIIAYKKNEIKILEKGLRKKSKGKPFELPIDYTKYEFFVEADELTAQMICEKFHQSLLKKLDTIFIKPDKRVLGRINRMFCDKDDDFGPLELPVSESRYFYSIKDQSRYNDYCFEFYEISGEWTRLSVENKASTGGMIFGIREGAVDPNARNVITYVIHEPSKTVTLSGKIKGAKLWKVL